MRGRRRGIDEEEREREWKEEKSIV